LLGFDKRERGEVPERPEQKGEGLTGIANFAVAQSDRFEVPTGDFGESGTESGMPDGKLTRVTGGKGLAGEIEDGPGEVVVGEGTEVSSDASDFLVSARGGGDGFSAERKSIHTCTSVGTAVPAAWAL